MFKDLEEMLILFDKYKLKRMVVKDRIHKWTYEIEKDQIIEQIGQLPSMQPTDEQLLGLEGTSDGTADLL